MGSWSVIPRNPAVIYYWGWLLLGISVSNSFETDVNCLKSLKEYFEDPQNSLSTWNFNTTSKGFICHFSGVECWQLNESKVLYVRLQGMGLKGEFPRGLTDCKSLTGIDLSNNTLSGTIPSDICQKFLTFASTIDLSMNDFSGKIPVNIAQCAGLNVLRLNKNRFTGKIPQELGLLARIRHFDVANNLLSGPVPKFVNNLTVPPSCYANNTGLCGGSLGSCSAMQDKKLNKIHFTCGFMVGWILFTVLSFTVAVGIPTVIAKKLMLKMKKPKAAIGNTEIFELERHVTRMRYGELRQLTENFGDINRIGMGTLGSMFKAVLPNGKFLAIKRVNFSQAFHQQFLSELVILAKLRHDNLVPLIGFCYEINQRFLVYKYMPNGNLNDFLISERTNVKFIEWPIRVKIAVGLAKGLTWLHQNGVLHETISTKSILLDQHFQPKISNFGAAKILNPDFASYGLGIVANIKSWESSSRTKDVCDFGTVLIELITQKEFSELIHRSKSFLGDLVELIFQLSFEVVHPCHAKSTEFEDEMFNFVRVALDCIQPDPERRPTMFEVLEMLNNNVGINEIANGFEIVGGTEQLEFGPA